MDLVAAALAGVVAGALLASMLIFRAFRKRGDRDWLERRIRACLEYRDCLGDLEGAFDNAAGDRAVLDQAWTNVRSLGRDVRRTGWLFPAAMRSRLETLLAGLEEEERRWRLNGAGSGGRAAQVLSETCREIDRILDREIERGVKELRMPRFPDGER